MNKRKAATWAVAILAVAFLAWKLHTSHFDWAGFWQECRSVDWRLLIVATLIIYSNSILRAVRWSVFLKPSLPPGVRVPWWSLAGPQFIGFSGLAVFGRVGELIRPYLVSKRTGLPFSSQIAVVAVERVFDLGAFALIFSTNLALAPQLNALPYHERFRMMGYAVAGITVFLFLFVLAVRLAGETMARLFGKVLRPISHKVSDGVAVKILEFRDGLNTIDSMGDFLMVAFLSLAMWLSIALAYVVVMRAFPSPVHDLTVAHCVLLMGFSVVGGVVQLPGVGGGAQLLTITALTILFHVPRELATSAGMIVWVVTTMSILLPGMIFARVEQVSLRSVARTSGAAADAPEPAL
jgi:uncharacterized protein (TIRG00374 family)